MSRQEPRVSLSKLAEYMTATPIRRKRIIHDQKRPRPFIVPRYAEAERAIVEVICSGKTTAAESAVAELGKLKPETEYEAERAASCVDAIESFLALWDDGKLEIAAWRAQAGRNDAPKLELGRVAVSVRPEVMLHRDGDIDGDTARTVGAIKLCICKSAPMNEASGRYAAALLGKFLRECQREARPDAEACFVVDVFAQQVYQPPKADKRRLRDLEAACEEIALWWPRIEGGAPEPPPAAAVTSSSSSSSAAPAAAAAAVG